MIGVQVKIEGDGKEILKQLARGLGQQVDQDRLLVPEYIGEGYYKAYALGKGLSAIVSRCCYKVDFSLKGELTERPVFVLQYDHISACEKEAADEVLIELAFGYGKHQHQQAREKGKMVKSVRVFIEQDWMEEIIPGNRLNEKLFTFLESMPGKQLRLPVSPEEKLYLKEIFSHDQETYWDDFYSVIRIELLLEKFIIRLIRQFSGKPAYLFSDHETQRLRESEAALLKDFSEAPPTISELAKKAGMSPSKFKADFRNMFGLPVYQYYQHSRMLQARTLMENKRMSIKQAGMMVGYSNLSHFSAAFKKEFGMLPKEFMERFKEKIPPVISNIITEEGNKKPD